MNIIYRINILITILCLAACTDGKERKTGEGKHIGNLYVSGAQPAAGDEIRLRYQDNPRDTSRTETTVNYIVGKKIYASDIDMTTDSLGVMKGQIRIPDTAQAISFNFRKHGIYDNNRKRGYILPVYDKNGTYVPGAAAAIASYVTLYGERYGIRMEADSVIALLEADLRNYPRLKSTYMVTYARLLAEKDRKAGTDYAMKQVQAYQNKESLDYQDYDNLYRLYALLNIGKEQLDSLRTLIMDKFPSSQLSLFKYKSRFFKASSIAGKLAILNELDSMHVRDEDTRDYMVMQIAESYAREGNWTKFMEYGSMVRNKLSQAQLYNSNAWTLANTGKDLERSAGLSRKSIAIIKEDEMTLASRPGYLSRKQYAHELEVNRANFMDTYAYILYRKGDIRRALDVQEQVVAMYTGQEQNAHHIQYLMETGDFVRAREFSEKYIEEQQAGDQIRTYLEEAYRKTENTDKGYERYLAGIEARARKHGMKEFRYHMTEENAPDFSLMDMEGNTVSLKSMKGKIVILDFWATWCGPCKESFPGMEKAVAHYRDNSDVVFLFVNTFEAEKNRKERAEAFIAQHRYPFRVLYDTGKKNGATATSYGVTGIPTKIVIGPRGKIRFRMVGYDGDIARMMEEIGYAVDILEKQKSKAS
ncbi:TlpA family protein disulfide reductase [Sinomicrobium soli]|uniref:TlpA family protein disulfide reductase n=1 Tax=Sinomicrobium sp. N-1-3-6 TaxID=2219864 RepID=UPI000DCF0AB0|nr:TlpA disulfide reductase family protein [Sinomicrobium sp. N-1-3-6]RAV28491.1 hypothetical protein DN748_12785 [Sinomicrobium sp. N-1-3-6]